MIRIDGDVHTQRSVLGGQVVFAHCHLEDRDECFGRCVGTPVDCRWFRIPEDWYRWLTA